MSLNSWKDEFYPVRACEVVRNLEKARDPNSSHPLSLKEQRPLLEHALKKWKGLESKNLRRHDVAYLGHYVFDTVNRHYFTERDEYSLKCPSMGMFTSSCALCQAVLVQEKSCNSCAIVQKTGRTCSVTWENSRDEATPMVRLLQEVLDEINKEFPMESTTTEQQTLDKNKIMNIARRILLAERAAVQNAEYGRGNIAMKYQDLADKALEELAEYLCVPNR